MGHKGNIKRSPGPENRGALVPRSRNHAYRNSRDARHTETTAYTNQLGRKIQMYISSLCATDTWRRPQEHPTPGAKRSSGTARKVIFKSTKSILWVGMQAPAHSVCTIWLKRRGGRERSSRRAQGFAPGLFFPDIPRISSMVSIM